MQTEAECFKLAIVVYTLLRSERAGLFFWGGGSAPDTNTRGHRRSQCSSVAGRGLTSPGVILSLSQWLHPFATHCPLSASEMTYIVSGGVLNSTHSLTHCPLTSDCANLSPCFKHRHLKTHLFTRQLV